MSTAQDLIALIQSLDVSPELKSQSLALIQKLDGERKREKFKYSSTFREHKALTHFLTRLSRDFEEQNKALSTARKKADAANRAKSNFLANMSHEIRTPMNAILGAIELMQQTSLDLEQKEYALTIAEGGRSLMNLLTDVLDLSKIEVNKLKLDVKPFYLRKCVTSVVKLFKASARQKGLNLNYTFDVNLSQKYLGAPSRISQILINLMSNAIKFSDRGEINLKVSAITKESGKSEILFEVQDQGIGIPNDKLPTIFEPFTEIKTNEIGRYQGTGLGLNICYHLVLLMEGRIWVESTLGEGSKFSVALPLPQVEEDTIFDNKVLHAPDSFDTKLAHKYPLRILLAEDNMLNQRVARNMLKKLGYGIDVVENGKEAITQCGLHLYDLVLMDINMPLVDGIEASRKILANYRGHTPPIIIALTANVVSQIRDECLEAGIRDFISKPFTFSILEKVLIHWGNQVKLIGG